MVASLESLGAGLAIGFMLLGLVGVIVPLIPGTLLIWLTLLVYAVLTGFQAITPLTFALLTLLALVTGTADFWLPLLGAKKGGASRRAMLLGVIGAIIGLFVGTLLGSIIGYAAGILLGEYWKRGDWKAAVRASLGGVAGLGVATAVQLGGGLIIILVFAWQTVG